MKQNILTFFLALCMIAISSGALYLAMTVYENDKLDEHWQYTPPVIQEQMDPIYNEGDYLITTE